MGEEGLAKSDSRIWSSTHDESPRNSCHVAGLKIGGNRRRWCLWYMILKKLSACSEKLGSKLLYVNVANFDLKKSWTLRKPIDRNKGSAVGNAKSDCLLSSCFIILTILF